MPSPNFISVNLIIIFILQIKNKSKEVDGELAEGRNRVCMFNIQHIVPLQQMLSEGREEIMNTAFGILLYGQRWFPIPNHSSNFQANMVKSLQSSSVTSHPKFKSDPIFSHKRTFSSEWHHHSFCWSKQKSGEDPSPSFSRASNIHFIEFTS